MLPGGSAGSLHYTAGSVLVKTYVWISHLPAAQHVSPVLKTKREQEASQVSPLVFPNMTFALGKANLNFSGCRSRRKSVSQGLARSRRVR